MRRQKSVTVRQIQNLDKLAMEKRGVSSLFLMENAGRAVAKVVLDHFNGRPQRRVCIFCGVGNNAGDGLVAARYLINAGVATDVLLIGRTAHLKADAAMNYLKLKNGNHPVTEIQWVDKNVREKLAQADLCVDAIFGVGLNREILEPFKSVIVALNASGKPIVAVDTPSGLNGTTGKSYGACIKAVKTVTFTFAKKGFLKGEGPAHTGEVIVADIGIPTDLLKKV